jgi:hypothetical protein
MCASFLHLSGSERQQLLQYGVRSGWEDSGCRLPLPASGMPRQSALTRALEATWCGQDKDYGRGPALSCGAGRIVNFPEFHSGISRRPDMASAAQAPRYVESMTPWPL